MMFVIIAATAGWVSVLAVESTFFSDYGNPQQCVNCMGTMYKDCADFKTNEDIEWCMLYKCWEPCGDPVDKREVTVDCDTCVSNCADDHTCIYHACGMCYDEVYEFRGQWVAKTFGTHPGVVAGVAVAAVLAVFALVWKLGFSKISVTETRDGSFQAL